MAKKVKITVLKRDLYEDIVKSYAADKSTSRCNAYEDGQEFVFDNLDMPAGFCSWAWADIQRDVVSVYNGAGHPWIENKNTIISCCTDGLRPVVFKIEQIDG